MVSDLPSPSALALQPGASKCQLLWSDLQLRRVLRRSAEPGEEEVEVLVEGATGATPRVPRAGWSWRFFSKFPLRKWGVGKKWAMFCS